MIQILLFQIVQTLVTIVFYEKFIPWMFGAWRQFGRRLQKPPLMTICIYAVVEHTIYFMGNLQMLPDVMVQIVTYAVFFVFILLWFPNDNNDNDGKRKRKNERKRKGFSSVWQGV